MPPRSHSTARPKDWAIYARISLDREGNELGIERQVEDCEALGRRLGLEGDPIIYTDNDISASNRRKKRPDYERLCADISARRLSCLVVWHTDRLHRRNAELEPFIDIVQPVGLPIHAVTASPLDLTTPSGRMQARIAGAVAQQEVEHKGERRARSAVQKAERGLSNGSTRGFGFAPSLVVRDPGGSKRYIYELDTVEAAAIRAAADALVRGVSARSIWRGWNERGLLTPKGNAWDGSTFRSMMLRPAIAGIATYKGEELPNVKAEWPAILPLKKWRAVAAVLKDPARRTSPGPSPKHLCGGITFCGAPVDGEPCGRKMKSAINSIKSKRTGERRNFSVYRCTHGGPGHASIKMQILDDAVYVAVIDALMEQRENPTPASPDDDERLVAIELDLAEVAARAGRLADAISLGIVSQEDALGTAAKIAADREALRKERESITNSLVSDDFAESMAAFWEGLDLTGPDLDAVTVGRDAPADVIAAAGRSLIDAMKRGGMDPEEARTRLAMEERFDDLRLDQRRTIISSLLRVTVHRADARADRIEVVPLREMKGRRGAR